VENASYNKRNEPVYSLRLRAGKRRTYFFDVRPTRSEDYYLTITESKKRFNEEGYDRHKIFLYKEDFNKFMDAIQKTVDHIKNDLLPDYDFDEFAREIDESNISINNNKTEPVEDVKTDTETSEEAETKAESETVEQVKAETTEETEVESTEPESEEKAESGDAAEEQTEETDENKKEEDAEKWD
jgi:Protein of unknown function (DUF3276)